MFNLCDFNTITSNCSLQTLQSQHIQFSPSPRPAALLIFNELADTPDKFLCLQVKLFHVSTMITGMFISWLYSVFNQLSSEFRYHFLLSALSRLNELRECLKPGENIIPGWPRESRATAINGMNKHAPNGMNFKCYKILSQCI